MVNDIVQLAWFYKPPTAEELKALPKHFETFILTKNDEDERDELKAQGVEAPFLQYISFDVIIDPGSCTAQPWRNQAADRPGDFCYISDNHPDWFMLDADGNRYFRANAPLRENGREPNRDVLKKRFHTAILHTVVHFELYRMSGHIEPLDLLGLQLDIAIDHAVGEDITLAV